MAKNEVTLSIENYNNLLMENVKLKEAFENTFKIVERWDYVQVEIDPRKIEKIILDMFKGSEFEDSTKLIDSEYWCKEYIRIGDIQKNEDSEGGHDDE